MRALTQRHPQLTFAGLWLLGIVLLAPALTQPTVALLLPVAVVGGWLAWKGVAYPLALSGIPALVAGINGTNPLPRGGATFIVAVWVGGAIALALMRGGHETAVRGLMSVPVAMAVLLLALMLFRLGPSLAYAYGSKKVQLYTADNLVLMIGAIFVGADAKQVRLFLLLSLAVAVAGALLLIEQILGGHGLQQYSGRFTLSAQEGAIGVGRESADGALIAIWLVLFASKGWLRKAGVIGVPLLLISLIAAGSRGPVIAFVIGLLTLLSLTLVGGRARQRVLIVAAVIVLGAIVVPFVVPGSAIGRALSVIVGGSGGLSTNGRSQAWALAYSTFSQHSLVGIGTGGFAQLEPVLLYPHNMLLEVAVELGIAGLLALLVMVVAMLRRLARLWRQRTGLAQTQVTLLIALLVSACVNAMVSGAIQDNVAVWLWGGIGVGLYVGGDPLARLSTAAP